MDPDQYEEIIKGINIHTNLLSDIKRSVRTIATLMILGVILGVLLGFCTALGL